MVYRRNSENEEWECIKKTEKTNCTDNKLKAGKNYTFKIVAYTEAGEEKVYSAYSATKKIKMNNFFRICNLKNKVKKSRNNSYIKREE